MNRSIIGKICVSLGLIISLNPYFIIFIGLPLFIIGVIIIWTTKKKVLNKALWSIIPILLWYPLMIGFYWTLSTIGTATAQKRDYIIPETLRNNIQIVESKCGAIPETKDGRLQFIIPENGIYLFNGELKSGYINEKIYIKSSNGTMREIENNYLFTKPEEKDTIGPEKIIGIVGGSFGTFGNNKSNFILKYVETNKVYDNSWQWRTNTRQNQIIDSLRVKCDQNLK